MPHCHIRYTTEQMRQVGTQNVKPYTAKHKKLKKHKKKRTVVTKIRMEWLW